MYSILIVSICLNHIKFIFFVHFKSVINILYVQLKYMELKLGLNIFVRVWAVLTCSGCTLFSVHWRGSPESGAVLQAAAETSGLMHLYSHLICPAPAPLVV